MLNDAWALSLWARWSRVGPAERILFWVCAGSTAYLGLVFVRAGMALLFGERKLRREPILSPGSQIAKDTERQKEQSDEDLLSIVGGERGAHPTDEVSQADKELADRLRSARERTLRDVRSWCIAGAVFGVLWMAVGSIGALLLKKLFLDWARGPETIMLGFHFLPAFMWGALICGAFIFSGWIALKAGLRFLRRRVWRPELILLLLWLPWVGSILFILLEMSEEGSGIDELSAISAPVAVAAAVTVGMYIFAGSFLRRPEVREVLGQPVRRLVEETKSSGDGQEESR
jgi:hypothetical protein